jgi:hypothetical protein
MDQIGDTSISMEEDQQIKEDLDEIQSRHIKGCNCKKSNCLKRYCECYLAKIQCSTLCKCVGCKNCDESTRALIQLANAADLRKQQSNSSSNLSTSGSQSLIKQSSQLMNTNKIQSNNYLMSSQNSFGSEILLNNNGSIWRSNSNLSSLDFINDKFRKLNSFDMLFNNNNNNNNNDNDNDNATNDNSSQRMEVETQDLRYIFNIINTL